MADAQIDGARIWYEVHGEGEDYLLQIGGAGFAHENFGFVTDKMTPHFKVIEFDLRGYGLSERPEQEYSMELWADDIKVLLDAIGVERTHVHGTSMGGMVALAFAGRYPEMVDGLVLDCASAKSDFMGARALGDLEAARAGLRHGQRAARARDRDQVPLARLPRHAGRPRDRQGHPGRARAQLRRAGLRRRLRRDGDHGPAAVRGQGHGADARHDRQRGLPHADRRRAPTAPARAGSPTTSADAELYVIEGSGHTNLMEQPELSAKLVIDFFQSVAAKRATAV